MAQTVKVPKQLRQLVKLAEQQGWRVEAGRRQHLRFFAPDRSTIVTAAGTPSDWRSHKNLTAQLRRGGLAIPHTGVLG